jgi:hypothetical protein
MATAAALSTPRTTQQSEIAENCRAYGKPNAYFCVFNAATKMAIRCVAHSMNPGRSASAQECRRKLEGALYRFYQACMFLGCHGGVVPAKAFRMMLTHEPWPRNEGLPLYSYGVFRKFMRILSSIGVLIEKDGLVFFPHWSAVTHPNPREVDGLRIYGKSFANGKLIPANSASEQPAALKVASHSKNNTEQAVAGGNGEVPLPPPPAAANDNPNAHSVAREAPRGQPPTQASALATGLSNPASEMVQSVSPEVDNVTPPLLAAPPAVPPPGRRCAVVPLIPESEIPDFTDAPSRTEPPERIDKPIAEAEALCFETLARRIVQKRHEKGWFR